MTHQWADQYFSDLAVHTLLQVAKQEPVSIDHLTQIVKSWDWSWFCISEMYEYFENNKDLSITDEQRTQISEWCYSNLNKVDFRKALIPKPNRQFSTSYLAIYLWFFLRKFDLKYPPSVLLDMLSFDWIEVSNGGNSIPRRTTTQIRCKEKNTQKLARRNTNR